MTDASITQLSGSLAAAIKDLKKFKEEQPERARKRKQDLENVKRTGTIDSQTRQGWMFSVQRLEQLMRQVQEFDMVWKDTGAMIAKIGADLKKDLALVEAASSGSDGALFKAKNLLRQQADALEAVVKRSQLLKSDLKPLWELVDRDGNVPSDDRKKINNVLQRSTDEIQKTLSVFESNLNGIAGELRSGPE